MTIINLALDPSLPAVEKTEEYLHGLNRRLYELFQQHAHNINLATGGFRTLITVTSNYVASIGDSIILVDASGGNRTINLPNAQDVGEKIFRVKKIDSSGNSVTVDPLAGNVDGAATKVWTTALQGYGFVSDGANYWTV